MIPRRLAPLLLTVALLGPTQSACTDPCENVDCGGGGAYVSWRDGDVPDASSYRLCVEGRCQPVEPTPYGSPEDDEVLAQAGEGRPEDPVAVRLEALAEDGEVVASFAGEREATGECCKAVYLQVEAPDRLVPRDD